MAIKTKHKRRPRPAGGARGVFPRRLSWREVEAAFNHLFDVSLHDRDAERILVRFQRARSQMLPIFSSMVVSPYERERRVALNVLDRVGGRATLEMIEGLIADSDVYEAFKLDLRLLRDNLAPLAAAQPDEDEEEGDELSDGASKAAESAPAARVAETRTRPGRSRRRKRGGAAVVDTPAPAPAPRPALRPAPAPARPALEPGLFAKPQEPFLTLLDEPTDELWQVFGQLPVKTQVSFVDRLPALADERLLVFLVPLLASTERAMVQSALKALGALQMASALPAIEVLLESGPPKTVRQRAERLRDELAGLDAPAAPVAEAGEQAPKPKSKTRRGRRGKPAPLPKEEPTESVEPTVVAAPEPSRASREPREPRESRRRPQPLPQRPADADSGESGLSAPTVPTLPAGEALPSDAKLPKLHACLASGLDGDGYQRLSVYRAAEGGLACVTYLVGDEGWLGASYQMGLAADADKRARADAAARGETLVEVTAAYVKCRVQQAAAAGQAPASAEAALAWLGAVRKADTEAPLPEAPEGTDQAGAEALLDHPLFATWRFAFDPHGETVRRWLETRGRRTASRQRRQILDTAVAGWLARHAPGAVALWLQRQAWLLQRAGDALAPLAAAFAAELLAAEEPVAHKLLREMAYRGFGRAMAAHRIATPGVAMSGAPDTDEHAAAE